MTKERRHHVLNKPNRYLKSSCNETSRHETNVILVSEFEIFCAAAHLEVDRY
jgi:hypothetical protein